MWWTINGLNSGGASLTIENTAVGNASTVRFINDASNNTLTECTLRGSASNISSGVVLFGSGITSGNDNNTISSCNIGPAGVNYPVNGIISTGSVTTDNSSNTVSNCNIYDYFSAGSPSCGINLTSTGNSSWTISGNRFYLGSVFTYTTGNTHCAINIGTGKGYTINSNYIGGANSTGTGTYTMAGTVASRFVPIDVNTVAGSPATSVQGNTVSRISLTTSSWVNTTSGVLCGINLTGAGDINIGTVTGNTIGASIGTGSLTAIPGTTQGTLVGIHSSSTGTVNISNNLMGALTSAATGATIAGGIIAVNISGTAAAALTIANNIIGNATADNIRAGVSGTTTGSSVCSGIYINANPVVATVSGNTIRNLSSFGNGTAGYARGIWTVNTTNGSSINWTISNNTIDNIKTNASTIGFANGLCSAQGIHLSAAPGCTISGNTVSNISNTSTAPANIVVGGIGISASALSTSQIIDVSRNNIRALSNSASSATSSISSTIFGIGIRAANNQVLVSNNMISLGNGITTNTTIIGIWNNNGASPNPTTNVYHNSVVIDGNVSAGSLASFGYLRGDLSANARTVSVELRNNIFENRRSGGAGQHFAISNNYGANASAAGWPANASDYNILNSASASTVGYWTSAQTFTGWQSASAGHFNSALCQRSYCPAWWLF